MIHKLQANLDAFFARVREKYKSWLPFNGLILNEAQSVIRVQLANLEYTVTELLDPATENGYDWAVDTLVDFVAPKIVAAVPWYVKPFVGLVLSQLATYLKANKGKFGDTLIGLHK